MAQADRVRETGRPSFLVRGQDPSYRAPTSEVGPTMLWARPVSGPTMPRTKPVSGPTGRGFLQLRMTMMKRRVTRICAAAVLAAAYSLGASPTDAQETRLLRQPSVSAEHVAFAYGADIWVVPRVGGLARRLTSTPAVESEPHFSPDGRWIAFTSNRSGTGAVYVVSVDGGEPSRLTWYPTATYARGWTPDGSRILYSSTRETAPTGYERLWTVSPTGGPSTVLPAPWAHAGSYSSDARRIVIDRMSRWDWEFRSYRGGQNTPLVILDLNSLEEVRLPNEGRTTDVQPVWVDGKIFFLSDRDWAMNVWSYDVASQAVEQVTHFTDADVKSLGGGPSGLVIEQDGWIHLLDPETGDTDRLEITVRGDFPWVATRWEDVSRRISSASLSPTGKRAVMEARGEIFTVPVENGDSRNLTKSSDAADRAPIWSPDGGEIAWFSDDGDGYVLLIAQQDGLGEPRSISIGESKMAWEPTWSPDGSRIAFVDDDVRVRVVNLESGSIRTVDAGGNNLERGRMDLTWSPDSRWLAYAKTFPNSFRRIVIWSMENGDVTPLTDPMADAAAPSWDRNGRHLYFLASTDLALGSSWASTSSITARRATYGVYVAVLRADDPTPFPYESDEEEIEADGDADSADKEAGQEEDEKAAEDAEVRIDFEGIDRRIISLPMPQRGYASTVAGPEGSLFIGARDDDGPKLYKFSMEDREADVFIEGSAGGSVSADGKKMLIRSGPKWRVVETSSPPKGSDGTLEVSLRMQLDRVAEWRQMFEEAWRYERDYFYDPGMHGNDWEAVRKRYEPLVEYVRHRSDLNYVFDQVNGELSVGHSFVFGGDFPAVDTSRVGLLGADLVADGGRWRLGRIYTFESWNPTLTAPLDRPGARIEEGYYLVGVNGVELTTSDDPYRLLDGTAGRQTLLHINDTPSFEGSWTETVEPIRSENAIRQRA